MPKETPTTRYHKIPSRLLSVPRPSDGASRRAVLPPEVRERAGSEVRSDRRYRRTGRDLPQPPRLRQTPASCRSFPMERDRSATRIRSIPANNGPYGEALTKEVIPFIERTYRCIGRPEARFTTGEYGRVGVAGLQIYYPDYFNGCWSQCPDSIWSDPLS